MMNANGTCSKCGGDRWRKPAAMGFTEMLPDECRLICIACEAIEERRAICEADGITGEALAAAIEHTREWAARIEREQ